MVTQGNINNQLFAAKSCLADLAHEYVKSVTYGYSEKAETLFNKIKWLKGAVRIFEDYEITEGVFAEDGFINRFKKKALLSQSNSLYLESKEGKVTFTEEDLNCFSEEELCELSVKISSISSIC